MKKGLFITFLGGLLSVIGLVFLPFFNLEEFINDPLRQFPTGIDFVHGQILLLFPLIIIAVVAIIYFLRLKREYSVINIVTASIGLAFQTYIFFASLSIFKTTVAIATTGYYLTLLGFLIVIFGSFAVLVATPKWDPNQKFLRVALIFKDTMISEKVLSESKDNSHHPTSCHC